MKLIKKLISFWNTIVAAIYNKMMAISTKENAMYALFVIAFAESSFFPIPPDVMIIPMVLAAPKKAWKIAFTATVASVMGGILGYYIGYALYETVALPILEFYNYTEQFLKFQNYYHEYGAWIVFGAGITPFPYKVITIASGVAKLDVSVFMTASIIARGIRFFLVAYLLQKCGAPMKTFIEKNLGLLATIFFIILIGGFYIIKLL